MRTPKDWGQPCPHPACTHSRRLPQGNVSALATYLTQRGKRRLCRCHTWATHVAATRETVFFDLRPSEEQGMMARKLRLVRVALAGIGFVRGVVEATVVAWLRRAVHPAEALTRHLLRALPVTQVQRDEMWHCSRASTRVRRTRQGKACPNGEEGRQGVWSSFAPAFRVMIAAGVGPRTLTTAQEGVAATPARVAGIPVCFSDGCTCSLAALVAAFHVVTTFARTGKRGRPRQARGEPHPALVYGPLVQQKKQGKWLTRSTRVVLGADRLAPLGCTRSTAWVERVNLPLRQALAPWARKTSSCCQDRERLRQRVVFFHAFYHVASPPMSLRQPLPLHERTHHRVIHCRWRARPPAMAAGVTAHVWPFRALLTAKFEPLDSQSIRE